MNRQMLDQMWDQMRQKYGVYLRALEAIPEERYQSHPVPAMRTPAELAVHISGTVIRDLAQGVAKGEVTADEAGEAKVAAGLGSRAAVIAFARQCWEQADAAVATIGNTELNATVATPWNMSFPGWVGFEMMNDEFLHHRGQLHVYARLCGVAPPFIWSFGENAAEFGPHQDSEVATHG